MTNQTQIANEIFENLFDDVTRRALAICDRAVTLGVLGTILLPSGASEPHLAIELERLAVAFRADETAGLGKPTERDTVRIFADGAAPSGFNAFDRPTRRVDIVPDEFDRPTRRVPVTVTATRIRRVA